MSDHSETDDKKTALRNLSQDLKHRLGRSNESPPERPPAEIANAPTAPPAVTLGEEVELPLDSLDASPFQLASRGLGKRDVEDLMDAIRANGQIQPILVSPGVEQGRFVVQSGHRRCAALRYLGANTVRAIVRNLTEREARRVVFADNLGRKDLSAAEKAFALRDYCDAYRDISFEQGAAELGVKKRTAQRLKALLDASEPLRDVLVSADIPAGPAAALAKIDARDPARAVRTAERYAAGTITTKEIEKMAQSSKQARTPPAKKTSRLTVTHREVCLSVNLTRGQIQLRAGALEEALNAMAQFLGHVGCQTLQAADVGEFDAMREVTQ